jgi:hypothetical protein
VQNLVAFNRDLVLGFVLRPPQERGQRRSRQANEVRPGDRTVLRANDVTALRATRYTRL